jgi:hypothetical protein
LLSVWGCILRKTIVDGDRDEVPIRHLQAFACHERAESSTIDSLSFTIRGILVEDTNDRALLGLNDRTKQPYRWVDW